MNTFHSVESSGKPTSATMPIVTSPANIPNGDRPRTHEVRRLPALGFVEA